MLCLRLGNNVGQNLNGNHGPLFIQNNHRLQQTHVDLHAPGNRALITLTDSLKSLPGADQVTTGEINPHLQAVQKPWHHWEQLRHAASFAIWGQLTNSLIGTVDLVLGQPAICLQCFKHRHKQRFVDLPGMHGSLGPANPDKSVFKPALGLAHQHADRHCQQQAQIAGLFGMTPAGNQQTVCFGFPPLMPEHQYEVQL